jgi:hypothetical protein
LPSVPQMNSGPVLWNRPRPFPTILQHLCSKFFLSYLTT